MTAPAARLHRFSRHEYEEMLQVGILKEDDRVELIDGTIYDMAPEGTHHAACAGVLHEVLQRAFGDGVYVREGNPLVVDEYSAPEPDIAVVPGGPRDYFDRHPDTALLVVEISKTSLPLDSNLKKAVYARMGLPEYWILNLVDSRLEVYREPVGDGFAEVRMLTHGDSVRPLAASGTVDVAEILPPRG